MNKPLNKNTLTPNSFTNFAYNGMKLDDEVSGNGNSYTTLFRELDVRLGRWWAVDLKAKKQPFLSPYNSNGNNPILRIDPFGLEDFIINRKGKVKSVKGTENNEGPDRLISGEAKYSKKTGELKNSKSNVLEIDKGILQNQKEVDDGHYFKMDNSEQATKLFKFVSEKTDVEFSLTNFENEKGSFSTLSTSHNSREETTAPKLMLYFDELDKSYPTSHSHNHPVYLDELGQHHLGSQSASPGDKELKKWINDNFLNQMQHGDIERKIKFYVYKDTVEEFFEY